MKIKIIFFILTRMHFFSLEKKRQISGSEKIRGKQKFTSNYWTDGGWRKATFISMRKAKGRTLKKQNITGMEPKKKKKEIYREKKTSKKFWICKVKQKAKGQRKKFFKGQRTKAFKVHFFVFLPTFLFFKTYFTKIKCNLI